MRRFKQAAIREKKNRKPGMQMLGFVRGVGEAFFDLVFPPCCAGCGARLAAGLLCESCSIHVEQIRSPRCPRCGIPFDGAGGDHLCGGCCIDPPPFVSTVAAFSYEGPIADGMRALKYGPCPERAGQLAKLWLEAFHSGAELPEVDLAVPVPLEVGKLRRRGFNQTVQLAKPLLRSRHIPLECGLLFRTHGGPTQASLTIAERLKAPRGAFLLGSRVKSSQLSGRRVLLLDDVMTTGATARECAKILLDCGAAEVHVAVLARTVSYTHS